MDIFDILGPVMMGSSSSHTAGVVRIGLLTRRPLGSEPVRVVIMFSGSFVATGVGHGTDRALMTGLPNMTPDDTRVPDSFELVKREGLDPRSLDGNIRDAHPDTTCLDVMDASGRTLEVRASSPGGGRIMLNKLDGTQINMATERPALIVHNVDKPGLVVIVVLLLARESINIATMSFYRSKWDGDAVVVTEVDQSIPEALVEDLKRVDGILKVTCLNV